MPHVNRSDAPAQALAALTIQPRPSLPPARRAAQLQHGVANTTLLLPLTHAAHEQLYRDACRRNVQKVAEAIHHGLTPSPLELARMSLLLGYKGELQADEESFAEDALTTLVRRKFNVHSDLGHVSAEMHVRLCYRAARKLRAQNVHKLSEGYQHRLIDQLLELTQFAQQQDNPNTLFALSCLRNAIVSVPNDASLLHRAFQWGIAGAQVVAGAAAQQPGSAASGVREAINLLSKARLHADDWYHQVEKIEKLDHAIEWGACTDNHKAVVDGCDALLEMTERVLRREVPRLRQFDSQLREKVKRAFNSLAVRQVDHEWDLAFACLDAMHRNVWAYDQVPQMQSLLRQVTGVLRCTEVPALRYKCIELLRDLRQLPSMRPICRVLLQMAGNQAAAQVEAVAKKRQVENGLRLSILSEARAEVQHVHNFGSGHAAPLQLNRSGSLRLQAPRYGAALTALAAAPSGVAQPPSIFSGLRAPSLEGAIARHQQPRLAAVDAAEQLRLPLHANEGLVLLCDTLRQRDAGELAALVRCNVHVAAERELTADEVRAALPERPSQGPVPKRLLGLAVVAGDRACVRALCATKPSRGFVSDVAVREAQVLAAHGRAPGMAETLAQALAANGLAPPRP